ncbi:uncharacterized protein LOC131147144 [Malania oleifera]|uniref:uncharacterized protein LOC131147144 n=1 Tax=Malania oleifera TaxID=397392 RepID=UPI0025ADB17E|nr:uncharacterized protein LOC131147144 [Malania oleifera]
MGGIWLYEIMNLTKKSLNLVKLNNFRQLKELANTIDEKCGYSNEAWIIEINHMSMRIKVYDAYWKVGVEVTNDKNKIAGLWDIQTDSTRINFIVEEDKIWFYPTLYPLKLDGKEHNAWIMDVNANEWKWEGHDIDASLKAAEVTTSQV